MDRKPEYGDSAENGPVSPPERLVELVATLLIGAALCLVGALVV